MEGQSVEELLNVIVLYKQALNFYADKTNYSGANLNAFKIDLDMGHQARFALEQGKKIDDFNDKMLEKYDELVKSYGESEEEEKDTKEHPFDEILRKLEGLKNKGA